MNRVMSLQEEIHALTTREGLERYLRSLGNVDSYRFSDYFNARNADLAAAREKWLQGERVGTELQKASADAAIKDVGEQFKQQKADAATLQRLQSSAETAQGRMEAIQYGNQFAAQMNNQLLELRAAFSAQQAMMATQMQLQLDREARAKAVGKALRSGTREKF